MPEEYLVDLEEYQRRLDAINIEFDAKIGDLTYQISVLNGEIASLQGQISHWGGEVSLWKKRWDTVREFAEEIASSAITGFPPWVQYYQIYDGLSYLNAWGNLAIPALADYRSRLEMVAREPAEKGKEEDIIYMLEEELLGILEDARARGETIPYEAPWWPSKHDFRTHKWHSTFRAYMEDLVARGKGKTGPEEQPYHYYRYRWGIKSIAWVTPSIADSWRVAITNQISLAEQNHWLAYTALRDAERELEANTRHMRDLKLAKEAAEEERRGAIALWQAEYYAAQERKRIELDSIARDILLGYPEMDAATARGIAESAYAEALARGFTRVADALTIAMALALEWYETHVFPHFTTKTIICSGCGATLELTMSDIAKHNRELNCPICGVYAC